MKSARDLQHYKREFWSQEHPKFAAPHFRLKKTARLVNTIAGAPGSTLLDVGCGPATLARLLRPNIRYYGIDIAVQEPGPNLFEADILESPIKFGDQRFDIVVAQGVFEYLADSQAEKFSEISALLVENGTFVVTYTNFAHRKPEIYHAYSNVQSLEQFRESLTRHFFVRRCYPTSHNWNHGQPNHWLVQSANMYVNLNVPLLSPRLAVEYFFICSPRPHAEAGPIATAVN